MTWTPQRQVIIARAIPENLLTYITDASRCRDALDWALGSSTTGSYKLLKKYTTSVLARTTTVYPCIAFSDDQDGQPLDEDLIEDVYRVLFEISVQDTSPDTALTQARVYCKAVQSMIVNCPSSTLVANTGATAGSGKVQSLEVGFLPIKTNEMQNDFLQQFQVRAGITLNTGAQ